MASSSDLGSWYSVTAQRTALPKANVDVKKLPNGTRWDEIVAAAAEVFNEVGYRAATLREIASRVGLLKGSLYYYIDSKEDLLYAVIQGEYDRGLTTLAEDDVLAASDAPTRLAAFMRRWIRVSLATEPQRSSLLVSETRHLDVEHLTLIGAQRQQIHTFVREIVSAGIEAGEFDGSVHPGVAVNSLFNLMDGSQQWYQNSGPLGVEELAEWYVTFFLRGLCRP